MITQLGQQEGQQLKSTNQIALLLIQYFPRKGWIYDAIFTSLGSGGTVASWLLRSSLDQAVRV